MIEENIGSEKDIIIENQSHIKLSQNNDNRFRKNIYDRWKDNGYLGENTWLITNLLGFVYFNVLSRYICGIDDSNLLSTSPVYDPMYGNQYLWTRLRKKRKTFSLFKQVFLAERGTFIVILFVSIFIGICALFGAFYQRYLFLNLQDQQRIRNGQHVQHPFETSGWVYFGIIIGAGVLRFFAFNYAQGLANQVSRNLRIHLYNCYFRVLMRLDQDSQHYNQGFLINNFYVSINVLAQAVKLLPYIILSIVIVVGISAFIIVIVGAVGAIVFGFVAVALLIQIGMVKYMLHLHHIYVRHSDSRTALERMSGTFMLRLTYNKLVQPFLDKIKGWRKRQTKVDFGYNTADGLMQIITQFVAVLTIFILYVIEDNHSSLEITFREIFEVAILFSVFRTPFKMVGYGMASLLQGYASIHRLQLMFDQCQFKADDVNFKKLKFSRLYNQNPCLKTQIEIQQQDYVSQIRLKPTLILPVQQKKLTMIVGKLDSSPSCDNFMKEIELHIRNQERTISIIDYSPFLIGGTIRDNIIFYHDFDQKKYNDVIQATHLNKLISNFPDGDKTQIQHNHFETLFEELSLKIEMARALYTNVDFLLINRLIFKEYQYVIGKIRKYRNQRKKTTIIVNLSGSYYHLADQIVVLSKNNGIQKGSYQHMKSNPIIHEFEVEYIKNSENVFNTKTEITPLMKLQEEKKTVIKGTPYYFMRFYGLVNCCVGPLVLILLLVPPLLDLYYEIIIAQTFQAQQNFYKQHEITQQFNLTSYSIVLRSGVTAIAFIVMDVLKVTLLALFIRLASYKLFEKMIQKFLDTSLEGALSVTLNNRSLDFQKNIQHLDTKFTSDMDLGITIIFQQITAVVFGIISSSLFLIIGIPFIILILIGLYIMARINRFLYLQRLPHLTKLNAFYFKLLYHKNDFSGYKIQEPLFQHYKYFLKQQILQDTNQQWLLEALGIILEILFLLMLAISIIISLAAYDSLSGDAFIQLSISFLIGLSNTSRVQLKMMEILNSNILGISNIFILLDTKSPKTNDFTDNKIDKIQFKNFSTKFQQNKAENVSFEIQSGERLVVVGSKRSGKRVSFLNLIKILKQDDIQGEIIINNISIYKSTISRRSIANHIYFLQKSPMILDKLQTVGQALSNQYQKSKEQIDKKLKNIWKGIKMEQQFTVDTPIKQLSLSHLDIYNILRGYIIEPSVLIVDGGMSHIDTINRQKLTRWIIKQKKQFSIIIDLTNRVQVIKLYTRMMMFRNGKLVQDQIKETGTIPDQLEIDSKKIIKNQKK